MGELVEKLFEMETSKKRLFLFILDSITAFSLMFVAVATQMEVDGFFSHLDTYALASVSTIAIIGVLIKSKLYHAVTRHVTLDTAVKIIIACSVATPITTSLILVSGIEVPIKIPLIHATLCCIALGGIRFFIRAIAQNANLKKRENVAIYGAGEAGRQLLEALKWNPLFRVCLLIDDNEEMKGHSIAGIKVESFEGAKALLRHEKIGTVLIATPAASQQNQKRIVDQLAEISVNVKTIPSLTSLISGNSDITELRDIQIEELLERPAAKPDKRLMSKTIRQKTVLVTGAGGSIGRELCIQIASEMPDRLFLFDISEAAIYTILEELNSRKLPFKITPIIGSVQDRDLVAKIIKQFNIQTIFHAAAYKHVPLMEQNVIQCIKNNVFGTLNVAEEAINSNVGHVILISTDKAVNPTNFMGASKRLAEIVCNDLAKNKIGTQFAIVRFGNVLGSSGSVVPLFRQQIANGGPLTVTHEGVTRYFMTIPEAAQLVIQAGALTTGNDTFILDMGTPIKIIELAKRMIVLSGKKPTTAMDKRLETDEILIKVIGLRPGEKMYEELAYDNNLCGTIHPRIMRTEDKGPSGDKLQRLVTQLRKAIDDQDNKAIFSIVAQVCDGVATPGASNDVFLTDDMQSNNEVVPLRPQDQLLKETSL